MEESQVTKAEKNRDNINNSSEEIPFLLFNRQIFLFNHTQTSLT